MMVCLVSYVVLLMLNRPWRHNILNIMDSLFAFALLGVLSFGIWFTDKSRFQQELTEAYSIWMFVCLLIPFMFFVGMCAYCVWAWVNQEKLFKEKIKFGLEFR